MALFVWLCAFVLGFGFLGWATANVVEGIRERRKDR